MTADSGRFIGVDIGSTWTKAVMVDGGGEPVARSVVRTGMSFDNAAMAALKALHETAGTPGGEVKRTISTGYGRRNAEFADGSRTEIACHAKGAFSVHGQAMTVIDIGGQDNKVIKVGADGHVEHFLMNRKCAAGTGAFIEEIARRLDIGLDRLESLAESATEEITLSSFCTVFSATEVLKLIREGASPGNICRGIFNSVVARVVEMGPVGDRIMLTGGVAAAFPLVAAIMEAKTGAKVEIPPFAQYTGALGAALFALEDNKG